MTARRSLRQPELQPPQIPEVDSYRSNRSEKYNCVEAVTAEPASMAGTPVPARTITSQTRGVFARMGLWPRAGQNQGLIRESVKCTLRSDRERPCRHTRAVSSSDRFDVPGMQRSIRDSGRVWRQTRADGSRSIFRESGGVRYARRRPSAAALFKKTTASPSPVSGV